MKKNARIGSAIIGALMLISLFAAFIPRTPSAAGGPGSRSLVDTATSALVTTAPTLDGQGTDTVWSQAPEITITITGGANTVGNVDVHFKSVFVGGRVYFYAHWADPQDSKDRHPWLYNATSGRWEQQGNTTSGDENTWYEDKLAMMWNISAAGFGGQTGGGPGVTCHSGAHYTNAAAEKADIWHWKRVRTGPVGQIDDQYLNNSQIPPREGRQDDPKTGGGYSDNKNTSLQYVGELPGNVTAGPAAWYPSAVSGDDGYYWVKKSDIGVTAYNFVGVYRSNGTLMDDHGNFANATAHVPGINIAPITGDRGNISAGAAWSGGFWTLEFGRDLVTGSQYDVQFSDTGPTAVYYFGLATYNNAQIDHNIGIGNVYALKFNQPPSTPTITWVPTSPNAGDVVTFTAASTDPDSDTLTYTWDFGDQSTAGTGISPTHTYATNGTFTVSVTVNDGHGHSVTGTNTITVNPKTVVTEQQGLSTTTIVIIIVVIVLIVVILAVLMGRRKKSAPEMMPPPGQP